MDWIDLAQGQVAVYREHSHGLLGFIKFGKMCEQLRNYQLVKKDFIRLSQLSSYEDMNLIQCRVQLQVCDHVEKA